MKKFLGTIALTSLISISGFAASETIPKGSCISYISVDYLDDIRCSSEWNVSQGVTHATCEYSYEIRDEEGEFTLVDTRTGKADGRHTGALGLLTLGLSELVYKTLIQNFATIAEAKKEAKRNVSYLMTKRCED
ncbi:MAG: hypothetical protein ACJAS4_003834 [Bacteriovoracaceae bacterium]|jgi:hypothetical protein